MFMFDKVYERNKYLIFRVKNGYIVYNSKKEFDDGHTHLKHFNACKTLIDLSCKKKLPRSNSIYFISSLIRISDDEKYIEKLKEFIDVKTNKTKNKYYCKQYRHAKKENYKKY